MYFSLTTTFKLQVFASVLKNVMIQFEKPNAVPIQKRAYLFSTNKFENQFFNNNVYEDFTAIVGVKTYSIA